MTTSDLWITDLSNGRSLDKHGGLFGPACDVAFALMDLVEAGRATAHPDHHDFVDFESTISGALLIELLRGIEERQGRPMTEKDGRSTISYVAPSHRYRIRYIEF